MGLPEWLLVISGLLALAVLLGSVAERVRLPVTVVLALVGFAASWVSGNLGVGSPLQGEVFEEVVVFLFLPVLIFEAAYGLSTRAFFRNLGPILVLAIPAVLVAALFVGLALTWLLGIPLSAALVFGALISATDPVAVVAIFRELGVPNRLLTLVEGESLLNDGVAIVLFTILLSAALGGEVSLAGGVLEFFSVFGGGALVGAGVGFVAALALPWLGRLAATALSVAVAYGGFLLADEIFGFSGVMATVASGLVLSGFAPSRAGAAVRKVWEAFWEALGYIANGLLFLLIGLAIDPALIVANFGTILLTTVIVLLARAVAVIPLMSALERLSGIPPVGIRNEAVLIWGGLRGGVALALALALPEELAQRELFITMTGGVVMATLLLNATTIGLLVHRLKLDEPSRTEAFLAGGARLSGVRAARERLGELGLENPVVSSSLESAEQDARSALGQLELTTAEEVEVVTRRGLFVERETYQQLSDAGLLPPASARALLREVDDMIEDVSTGRASLDTLYTRETPLFERFVRKLTVWLPQPLGEDPAELAYAEATARRLAARRTLEALELFEHLPNLRPEALSRAERTFVDWEEEAVAALGELGSGAERNTGELHKRQAEALSRVAATEALGELTEVGLLPPVVAQRAAAAVVSRIDRA